MGGQENVSLQQAEDCRMFICFRRIEEALGRAGLKVMTNGAWSELLRGMVLTQLTSFYLVNTRMRSKRDIKIGRLCTPGGAVLGIVGGGVTFRFQFKW